MSGQVGKQVARVPIRSIRKTIFSPQGQDKIAKMVPPACNPQAFGQSFCLALEEDRGLLDCTESSLLIAMQRAALCGFTLHGSLREAALIKRWNAKKRVFECNLDEMWRGLVKLMLNSGEIRQVVPGVVHMGDVFEDKTDDPLNQKIVHRKSRDPKRFERPVEYIYVAVEKTNGVRLYEVWSADQVNAHRDRYGQNVDKEGSAWKEHWIAMGIKSVIKSLAKSASISLATHDRRVVNLSDEEGATFSVSDSIPSPMIEEHDHDALPDNRSAVRDGETDSSESSESSAKNEDDSDSESQQVLSDVERALLTADSLGKCSAIRAMYQGYSDPELGLDIEELIRKKEHQIRESRSEQVAEA